MDRLRVTQTTFVGFIITLVIACLSLTADAQIPNIPQNVRKAIELTLGAKGIYIPSEGAFKVRMVRKDIQQTAVEDGFPGILPESWAAFGPAFHQQEGEFVATESELQSVLKALRSKRLQFISIRTHTVGEHPQLIFVRFQGEGSAVSLAQAIRYALNVQFGLVGPSV